MPGHWDALLTPLPQTSTGRNRSHPFQTAAQLTPFWSIVLLQTGLSRQALFCSRSTQAHCLGHLITLVYKGIAKIRNTWNNPEDQSQTNRAEKQTATTCKAQGLSVHTQECWEPRKHPLHICSAMDPIIPVVSKLFFFLFLLSSPTPPFSSLWSHLMSTEAFIRFAGTKLQITKNIT